MWPLVSVIVGSLMTVQVDGKALNRTQFEDKTHTLTDLWSQVKRDVNQSDLIVPTLCNAPCDRLFHAVRHRNISDCLCRCPEEMPIFLQTLGQCIQRIEACPRTIKFNDAQIPVVELPVKSHKLSFNHKVMWKESGVKVKTNTGARCSITSVEYLGRDQSWIELNANILYMGWDKEPIFKWNGSLGDNLLLEGTIILVNMDCSGHMKDSHCLTFRVNGALCKLALLYLYLLKDYGDPFGNEETSNRGAAFFVITLLVILLIMTLSCSVFIWNVCWKMKKNELITGLQLQFLYRLKQEKDMAEAAQHYQALAHAALNMEKQHDEYNKRLTDKSQITPKRKLFFSPEFFDEEHMKTPPPMADQFLLDLRRMIKIARQRIHQQRHIPSLKTIPEEPPELFESYMKIKSLPLQIKKTPELKPVTTQETSPKSINSVHSSIDCSADSAKENKSPEWERRSPPIRRNKSQSRIPVNKYKTKSPKLNPKFIIPSTNSSIYLPPPLPPRNPPPPVPAKYRLKEDITKMKKDKKSYAILSSELEFEKSLPRRARKLDERVISNEL